MAFAHFLLALKMRLDGCKKQRQQQQGEEIEITFFEDGVSEVRKSTAYRRGSFDSLHRKSAASPMTRQSITYRRRSQEVNLTDKMTVGEAFQFNQRRRSSVSEDDLVISKFRGFHYTIDARFYTPQDAKSLGEEVVAEMLMATKRHGIRSVGEMLRVFDGSGDSPPGFASVVLLDESHMTAHCYSDEGMLAFDCFTCESSHPEGTRRMAVDMVNYLQHRLGATAKIEVGHMPRFPVNNEGGAIMGNEDDPTEKTVEA